MCTIIAVVFVFVFVVVLGFIFGLILFPLVLFIRARRDSAWDDSNMTNMYRLIAHIATHPSDFGKMQFPNGDKPFWYINKDEITEVVKTRPE